MQMRRFDGSTDWGAPVAAVDAAASSVLAGSVPTIGRRAVAAVAAFVGLVLALSLAV
jgi:hypothetical protein